MDETQPTRAVRPDRVDGVESDQASRSRWQRLRPLLLWGMGFLVLLILGIGGAVYAGFYFGEQDRAQEQEAIVEQHYQKGLKRLEEGEYELARAEFEYVLKIDPDHPLAQQGIDEARAHLAAQPTPTEAPQDSIADDMYQQAVADYEAERWQDAAATLTQLRQLDSEYEAEKVEEMLFRSRYNAGMELLEEDSLELGIFYLDQAVALRPLDEEATTQRRLAVKYLTARDHWGVDWERCIEHFEDLYAIAPNYKDVFQRLYRAHVNYADAWYDQGEMCPAEEQYAQALRLMNSPEVEQRQAEAAEICLVATPTPIAPVEGRETITMTTLPPGFAVGRLAYPAYDTATGRYDVFALFAEGRLMKMATGADQPCWVWGSRALGYRDLFSPGLSLIASGTSTSQRLVSGAGLAWPTFSPDGSRMAYAAQDAGGSWQIYIAPTDGSAESEMHAAGKGPTWGPNGWLAWTGCDAEGTCGIFVDNPDDDQEPGRLSAGISDVGLNWSPDGGNLAYMSNHTGNWEVYLVSTSGGFAQLTDNPASDGLPAWAPDGSGIAFVSNRGGSWALYVMQPNGDNPQKILTLGPNLPYWTTQRISWAP